MGTKKMEYFSKVGPIRHSVRNPWDLELYVFGDAYSDLDSS